MAAEKKVNYKPEELAEIVARHVAGESARDIAESVGRAFKSVVAKLVHEGVYRAEEKAPKAKREEGPSKKELLDILESIAPSLDMKDFANTNIAGLKGVIALLSDESQEESEAA